MIAPSWKQGNTLWKETDQLCGKALTIFVLIVFNFIFIWEIIYIWPQNAPSEAIATMNYNCFKNIALYHECGIYFDNKVCYNACYCCHIFYSNGCRYCLFLKNCTGKTFDHLLIYEYVCSYLETQIVGSEYGNIFFFSSIFFSWITLWVSIQF